MIEVLSTNIPKRIISVGLKGKKALPKHLRKRFFSSDAAYVYIALSDGEFPELSHYRKEHDALIIVKELKPIKRFMVNE